MLYLEGNFDFFHIISTCFAHNVLLLLWSFSLGTNNLKYYSGQTFTLLRITKYHHNKIDEMSVRYTLSKIDGTNLNIYRDLKYPSLKITKN